MIGYSELYPVNNKNRCSIKLDGLWKFQFDEKSEGLREQWMNGLPHWISMPVPASFADFFTDKKERDYTGDFWYETGFYVEEKEERRIWLRFGSITHRGIIYVNGQKVGEHEGGFLPFAVDVTQYVTYGEENRLSILANNELSDKTLPCGAVKIKKDGRKISTPYFDFFNYAGIQRSVWLEYIPNACIIDYNNVFEIHEPDASIHYSVQTNCKETDGYQMTVELYDADHVLCCTGTGTEGTLEVKNAHLWNVRDAYLYQIRFILSLDGKEVDSYENRLGIRTVAVEDGRIQINGKAVYLKGFGKHEDFEVIGRGQSLAVMKRDFECMKWIHANCFRTSHYPYAEEWYQLADEEGFLIIDEVPAVGMMKSLINFMAAGMGRSNTTFFEGDNVPELKKNHIKAVEEMITRDKNHPSVIAWSMLNEPETITEYARDYFSDIFAFAKTTDPQKRPVTGALEKTSSPEQCKVSDLMDFICLNRYYGWYIFGGSDFDEAKEEFIREMDAWVKRFPDKPFVFTEYGADTLSVEHKLPSVMWSQEYQQEMIRMNSEVFDTYENVQGELIWNFADFQTGEGIMRVNGNKKGVFTRNRQPKDIAFFLKERWNSQ